MLDTLLGFKSSAGNWLSPANDALFTSHSGIETHSGATISEDTALTITTVFACVSKIAKTISSLPVDVVEKTDDRTRRHVDHPLEELLDGAANDDASGMSLREAAQANLELWGNAYIQVDWKGNPADRIPGRLHLIPSVEIQDIKRNSDTGKLVFIRNGRGGRDPIPADRMWHIPGFSLNGIAGVSTVRYNCEALGIAKSANDFSGSFFGNGLWCGGFITRPNESPELSAENGQKFIDDLNAQFQGAKKAFGWALLRESMEMKQIDIPFEDAMLLGTRKFQRVEICGMFDVPIVMIHDNEHGTYSNTEQADLAYAKHSITPRCERIERSARKRFFSGTKYRLKHNMAALVRGDFKTRMEGYRAGLDTGLWCINDCLEMEDRNPVEGGDRRFIQLNRWPLDLPWPVQGAGSQAAAMATSGDVEAILSPYSYPAATIPQQGDSAEESDNPTALDIVRPMIEHVAERIATRQCKAADAPSKKYARDKRADAFTVWADKFFVGHAEAVRSELIPLLQAYKVAGGTKHPDPTEWAGGMCRVWQKSMMDDPGIAVDVVAGWKCNLAKQITSHICEILEPKEESEDGHE